MHLHMPVPVIRAGVATGVAAVIAAASMTPTAHAARQATAARAAGPGRQIFLINGDRVLMPPGTRSPGGGILVPPARVGLAGTLRSLSLGGHTYKLPQAALPYLGRGLDPSLFGLSSLLAHKPAGAFRCG